MNMKAGGQITERLSHTVIYKHAAHYTLHIIYIKKFTFLILIK